MQKRQASEWILKHLPLKHLTQKKSVTRYEGGLHSFTSTHQCKPMWADVLCWGSGSSGGNWGRDWFTWQQPLELFRRRRAGQEQPQAVILMHISMRIKPPSGLKQNATNASLSQTSSSASTGRQHLNNLHHQQCCTSTSLVLPSLTWELISSPLSIYNQTATNSCKTIDMAKRGQPKWQRGWVQRKQVSITEGVIFPLSEGRRYCSSCSHPTRDKQAPKKIQLLSRPVCSSLLTHSCSSFTNWYKRCKDQKRLRSCPTLFYTVANPESVKTPTNPTSCTSARIFFEREIK